MIQNLLTTCGLNSTERKVFLYVLEHGASIASMISKRLHVKRPTIYAALENLVQFGIVLKQKRQAVTYFVPLSASMIPEILEDQARKRFEEVQNASKLLGSQLAQLENKQQDIGGFQIQTIETPESFYAILFETLVKDDFAAIFNPQRAHATPELRKIVDQFLEKTAKNKASIREIAVASPLTERYKTIIRNPNHLLKEMPKDTPITSDMIFVDGTVFVANYNPEDDLGIKIFHKEYYESMMGIFELLWEKLD